MEAAIIVVLITNKSENIAGNLHMIRYSIFCIFFASNNMLGDSFANVAHLQIFEIYIQFSVSIRATRGMYCTYTIRKCTR